MTLWFIVWKCLTVITLSTVRRDKYLIMSLLCRDGKYGNPEYHDATSINVLELLFDTFHSTMRKSFIETRQFLSSQNHEYCWNAGESTPCFLTLDCFRFRKNRKCLRKSNSVSLLYTSCVIRFSYAALLKLNVLFNKKAITSHNKLYRCCKKINDAFSWQGDAQVI